jgi:hypothetical protein
VQAQVRKNDAKRFLRAISETFEVVSQSNPGKEYNLSFSVGFAIPQIGKTSSEIKSLLSRIETMLSQFAETDALNLDIEIDENKGVAYAILEGTKDRYESSKKLETGIPEAANVTKLAAK